MHEECDFLSDILKYFTEGKNGWYTLNDQLVYVVNTYQEADSTHAWYIRVEYIPLENMKKVDKEFNGKNYEIEYEEICPNEFFEELKPVKVEIKIKQ